MTSIKGDGEQTSLLVERASALDPPLQLNMQHAEAEGPKRVLVLSDNVKDHGILLGAANAETAVVLLEYNEDHLDSLFSKISEAAGASAGQLLSIGFVDHGRPGKFCLLEGKDVTLNALKQNKGLRAFFQNIARLLAPMPDGLAATISAASKPMRHRQGLGQMGRIDLLACSLADSKSNELLEELELITGFNVAASTDASGNKISGGNWLLETDSIDAGVIYFDAGKLKEWKGNLSADGCFPPPTTGCADGGNEILRGPCSVACFAPVMCCKMCGPCCGFVVYEACCPVCMIAACFNACTGKGTCGQVTLQCLCPGLFAFGDFAHNC